MTLTNCNILNNFTGIHWYRWEKAQCFLNACFQIFQLIQIIDACITITVAKHFVQFTMHLDCVKNKRQTTNLRLTFRIITKQMNQPRHTGRCCVVSLRNHFVKNDEHTSIINVSTSGRTSLNSISPLRTNSNNMSKNAKRRLPDPSLPAATNILWKGLTQTNCFQLVNPSGLFDLCASFFNYLLKN